MKMYFSVVRDRELPFAYRLPKCQPWPALSHIEAGSWELSPGLLCGCQGASHLADLSPAAAQDLSGDGRMEWSWELNLGISGKWAL